MAAVVRDADLETDRDELIRFLRENLTERSDDRRFDWLYLENPLGSARAWIGFDSISGRTIGVAAAFPRAFWVQGKVRRAWVLGDFCIAAESRSLGPALLLQRACLTRLESEGDAVYDFPSRSMLAIYRRLGVVPAGHQVRYVKVLRVNTKLRRAIAQESVSRGVSILANLVLRLQDVVRSAPADVEISMHDSDAGEEFTDLDASTAGQSSIRGQRSAAYLNWRYLHNPLADYRVITARRRSELVGYAVLEPRESDWTIADLQTVAEPGIASGLLVSTSNVCRAAGAETVSVPVAGSPSFITSLRGAGFLARESQPVIVSSRPVGVDFGSWFLTHGDRDS